MSIRIIHKINQTDNKQIWNDNANDITVMMMMMMIV